MRRISYLIAGGVIAAVLMQAGFTIAGIWTEYGLVEVLSQAEGDARYVEVAGDTMTGKLRLDAAGLDTAAGVDLLLDPSTTGHTVIGTTNAVNALLIGDATSKGSLTAVSSNGTAVLTKATHGLTLLAGDLAHITGATTAADKGFYQVVSADANTITLTRALAGTQSDVAVKFYRDVLVSFAGDGTNGMWLRSYARDKPLQIGGHVRGAPDATLKGEDVFVAGKLQAGGGVAGPVAQTAGTGVTALDSTVTLTGASGTATAYHLKPTINQSSTAGYTGLLVDVTETGTGSGTKNLLDLRTAGVSRARVDNNGVLYSTGLSVSGVTSLGATVIQNGNTVSLLYATRFNSTNAQTGTSQTFNAFEILPTYNQPSATSVINRDLYINRTETSLGTTPGAQSLIWAGVGGAQRFRVASNGDLLVAGDIEVEGTVETNAIVSLTTDVDLVLSGAGTGVVQIDDSCEITNALSVDNIASLTADTDLTLVGTGTGMVLIDDTCDISGLLSVDGISSRTADTNLTLVGKGTGIVQINDDLDVTGNLAVSKRTLGRAGADVASANDITLGDGNFFVVTGVTQIQRIAKAGWTAGSRVLLQFAGIAQVAHATAGDATWGSIHVTGGSAYDSATDSMAEAVYDGGTWFLAPVYTP